MAHSCPECGLLCHCRGDIDDCQTDGTEAELMCEHCDGCDDDPTEAEDDRQFREPLSPNTQAEPRPGEQPRL
jgi:hypothetical protein